MLPDRLDHNVHQPGLDNDDLPKLPAGHGGGDFLTGQGLGFDLVLASVGSNHDPVFDLAANLNRQFDLLLSKELRVVRRPRRIRKTFAVPEPRKIGRPRRSAMISRRVRPFGASGQRPMRS